MTETRVGTTAHRPPSEVDTESETGIRLALGAQIGDVRTLFLRHGLDGDGIGIVVAPG